MIATTTPSIIQTLIDLNGLLLAPAAISSLFSGINFFLPKQDKFSEDHQALNKTILKKRSLALANFVASVEFIPDSIMEVKEVGGEDFFLQMDKYSEYKEEFKFLKDSFYKLDSQLRNSFFGSMIIFVVGFLNPVLKLISFFVGILLILYIYTRTRKLSQIREKIHSLKINPDLTN